MRGSLRWRNVEAVPVIHGCLAFAMEVRKRMLSRRYSALAIELPPTLRSAVLRGVDQLPLINAVLYREIASVTAGAEDFSWAENDAPDEPIAFDDDGEEVEEESDETVWYVPIDPCDAMIEAMRIAQRERMRIEFVDAEVESFVGREFHLPDAHAIHEIGLDTYYEIVSAQLTGADTKTAEDELRERHMAARLRELSDEVGDDGTILFVCGLAHWGEICRSLNKGTQRLDGGEGPPEDWVELVPVRFQSLPHLLGETPYATYHWVRWRDGLNVDPYDPSTAIGELLLLARSVFRELFPRSLDRPTPALLSAMVNYIRKFTVRRGRLYPDLYTLVLAGKGVVGNDFALAMLEAARTYPYNRWADPEAESEGQTLERMMGWDDGSEDGPPPRPSWLKGLFREEEQLTPWSRPPVAMTHDRAKLGDEVAHMRPRAPGMARILRPLKLIAPPPKIDRERWRTAWDPAGSCSWPPEDVVIESFRSHVTQRALSLAGVDLVKVEEFRSSMKDGLAVRETARDLALGKIYVKEEPRVPGQVGAVVMIFEEDDAGLRYPWRITWMAEHDMESVLAFYATDPQTDLVGPGVARALYGGCMMIFPPRQIPEVWDDLRFEQARRPSERLLLAALWHSEDLYVAHLSHTPPSPEIRRTAAAIGRRIVHLPLSSFSAATLRKLRRFHVLNGQQVRSWAARFIR